MFPWKDWSDSQGTGPYMHFDNGSFNAVTSTGTYWGHPAPYDPAGFTQMIQSVMGSAVDITYASDGGPSPLRSLPGISGRAWGLRPWLPTFPGPVPASMRHSPDPCIPM